MMIYENDDRNVIFESFGDQIVIEYDEIPDIIEELQNILKGRGE